MKCSANNDKSTIAEPTIIVYKWDHFTVESYV